MSFVWTILKDNPPVVFVGRGCPPIPCAKIASSVTASIPEIPDIFPALLSLKMSKLKNLDPRENHRIQKSNRKNIEAINFIHDDSIQSLQISYSISNFCFFFLQTRTGWNYCNTCPAFARAYYFFNDLQIAFPRRRDFFLRFKNYFYDYIFIWILSPAIRRKKELVAFSANRASTI